MEDFPQLKNPHDESVINITNSSFSIGRSLSCDHIIQSLNVSRFHCIIKKDDNKWTLYDRSSNGTVVNSTLYRFNENVDLKDGDVVKLGPDNLDFVFIMRKKVPESLTSTQTTIMNEDVAILEAADLELVTEFQQPFEFEVATTEQSENCQNKNTAENSQQKGNPEVKLDIMENELTCSICSELFIKPVTLNCSHTFCKFCIDQWKKNKFNCPICRNHIQTVAATLVLDNFIEKFIETQSDDVKETRKVLIQQRDEVVGSTASSSNATGTNNAEGDVEIIQILSDNDDDDVSNYSDYSEGMYDSYDYDEDCEYDDPDSYPGSRGPYYGGYGRCFICNQSGHWANGCPFKRR